MSKEEKPDKPDIQPKYLNMIDTAKYIGVTYDKFREFFRPKLTEVTFGKRPYFEVLEIDAFLEEYKSVNGRAPRNLEVLKCQKRNRQALLREGISGTSANASTVYALEKALERVTCARQSTT